jgi:hypothetical protein
LVEVAKLVELLLSAASDHHHQQQQHECRAAGHVAACLRPTVTGRWLGYWNRVEYVKLTDQLQYRALLEFDHLESLLFLADYKVNWRCFDSATLCG